METLAIDIGSENVGLCKWDGRTWSLHSRPTRSPEAGWSDWLRTLCPTGPYEVLYRCTHPDFASPDRLNEMIDYAMRHGAQSVRHVEDRPQAGPILAAARATAERHRLTAFRVVEIGARNAIIACADLRSGRAKLHRVCFDAESESSVNELTKTSEVVCSALRRDSGMIGWDDAPLICFGGRGPALAAELTEACGADEVLIPDRAGLWTTIGMLMADIFIEIREDSTPAALDLPALREAFARLMDRACTAITREGYDLDNAVCRRLAEMGCKGEPRVVVVDCDDLGDESRLREQFGVAWALAHSTSPASERIEVRAVRVEATVETLKPELPVSPACEGCIEDAELETAPAGACNPAAWPVYAREKLPVGAVIQGPACIVEPDSTTRVPADWMIERTPCGDLRLSMRS